MTTLPQQGKIWSQAGDRDNFIAEKYGSLLASMGLDLSDNPGRVRLAPRMILNTSNVDVAEITGVPFAFIELGGNSIHFFAGASSVGYDFANDGTLTGAFTKTTAGTAPSTIDSAVSGATLSNNAIYVTAVDPSDVTKIAIYKKLFNSNYTKITTTSAHQSGPMPVFNYGGRTYVVVAYSSIISLDSADSISYTGANTLTLNGITQDGYNSIIKGVPSKSGVYLLTLNLTGGRGTIYFWDGASTTHQDKFILESSGALCGTLLNDVLYIMDTNGNLQSNANGAFRTVASLYRKNKKILYNALSITNNRFCNPESMTVCDGKIRIVVDNRNYDSTLSIEETIPAGIYEFDPANPSRGLYNKYPFATNKSTDTLSDFGQMRIAGAGGIAEINFPSTSATRNGSFLAGCGYYYDDSIIRYGAFYDDTNDTLQKAGSFITLKFDSTGIKDIVNALRILYRKLQTSGDKIVAKYIYEDSNPVEATITWIAPNQFTVLNSDIDLTSYKADPMNSKKGAEVEVTQGVGSNVCTHITDATLSGSTWTVTVDENFVNNVSLRSKARFKKWIWLGEKTYDDGEIALNTKPDLGRSWYEFKVWAKWTGKNEIERLITNGETILPTNLE